MTRIARVALFATFATFLIIPAGRLRADVTAADLIKDATDAAGQMKDGAEKTSTMVEIADGQAVSGDIDGAKKTAEAISDPSSKNLVYGNIAQALVDAQKLDSIWGLLDSADAAAKPGIYFAIVKAQVRNDKVSEARQTADKINDPFLKGQAMAEIAQGQAQDGDYDEAKETAGGIGDPITAVTAYCKIAEAQAMAGKASDALATIELAKTESKQVHGMLPLALAPIAAAQIKAGDTTGAGKTLAGVTEAGDKTLIYNSIIDAQIEMNNLPAAADTASHLTDDLSKVDYQLKLAEAQANAGNAPATQQALQTAMALVSNQNASPMAAYYAEQVAKDEAKLTGDPDDASQWAHAQTDPQMKAYALIGVAEGIRL